MIGRSLFLCNLCFIYIQFLLLFDYLEYQDIYSMCAAYKNISAKI